MVSEFGKGLTYCLGLFLSHAEREMWSNEKDREESDANFAKFGKKEGYSHTTELWFNGASDHLYELQIPKTLPVTLQKRLKRFQKKVLDLEHGFNNNCVRDDKPWAINEAQKLLMLIDKANGIKTMVSECH